MRVMEYSLRLLALVLLLSTCVLAEPRIALIKVERGTATLDGTPISRATIASENQVLSVGKNSEVHIKILGSNHEVTISEETEFVLKKVELLEAGTPVKRSAVKVAADLGDRNTVAAIRVRNTVPNLKPNLPPVYVPNRETYVILWGGGKPVQAPSGYDIHISVTGFDKAGKLVTTDDDFAAGSVFWATEIPAARLDVGGSYQLDVTYLSDSDKPDFPPTYQTRFRLLTPEEQKLIDAAQEDAAGSGEVLPLLEFASLLEDLDQNEMVLTVLKTAREKAVGKTFQSQLDALIEQYERLINMPNSP
jgi:hypothetical protein